MEEGPQKPGRNGDTSPAAEGDSLPLALGAFLVEALVDVAEENGGERDKEAAEDQEPGGDGWVEGERVTERLVVAEETSVHVEASL